MLGIFEDSQHFSITQALEMRMLDYKNIRGRPGLKTGMHAAMP